jgi:hypothetical protein
MSCDKNHDVLYYCLQSLKNNINLDKFTVFVGTNTENNDLKKIFNFHYLTSPMSNWKNETLYQLQKLSNFNNEIDHVIVVLDDFIISKPIDENKIISLYKEVLNKNIQYLKLKSPTQTIKSYLIGSMISLIKKNNYFKIPDNNPYYSSLQIAIWNTDHLINSVDISNNIWDFEELHRNEIIHYTVFNSVIKYKHVIEKGKWDYSTTKYLTKIFGKFEKGSRDIIKLNTLQIILINFKKYFIFPLFGYTIMKFRSYVKFKK